MFDVAWRHYIVNHAKLLAMQLFFCNAIFLTFFRIIKVFDFNLWLLFILWQNFYPSSMKTLTCRLYTLYCRKITLAKSRVSAKLKTRPSVCMITRDLMFKSYFKQQLKPHSDSSRRQVSLVRNFTLKSTGKVSKSLFRYFRCGQLLTVSAVL